MPERVEVTVVRNRGHDYLTVPTRQEGVIGALLADRAGYIRDGHTHLIPAVDAMLVHQGYTGELPTYEGVQ